MEKCQQIAGEPHVLGNSSAPEEVSMSMDRSDDFCCDNLMFSHRHGFRGLSTLSFTRELGLFNGKPHYKSDNGIAVIVYACGGWLYQPASMR